MAAQPDGRRLGRGAEGARGRAARHGPPGDGAARVTGGVRAEDRLQRLLYILPAAGGAEGADLGELAGLLGTDEARIMEDVTEVTKRTYYHPGGWPDDIVIELSADRIRVVHDGGLTRPPRLTEREMLCLAMALRGTRAATHLTSGEERLALLRRVEAHLRVPGREGAPGGAAAGAARGGSGGGGAGRGAGRGGGRRGASGRAGAGRARSRSRRGWASRNPHPGGAGPPPLRDPLREARSRRCRGAGDPSLR